MFLPSTGHRSKVDRDSDEEYKSALTGANGERELRTENLSVYAGPAGSGRAEWGV
jgi:hypothetical protein